MKWSTKVRGYTIKTIGLNSTKLLKKMATGGLSLNIKLQEQAKSFSIVQYVRLLTKKKKLKKKNTGAVLSGRNVV
ncbi:hypothetical protein DD868_11665 [Staphylococcus pseudintermedius]|nr:hypothetical protein DD868_11665 [Staphylococcus pseudintermedius]